MVSSLGPLSFAKSCDISNYVANGFNQVVIGTWGTANPFNLTKLSELFEHHRLPQRDGVYFLGFFLEFITPIAFIIGPVSRKLVIQADTTDVQSL